MSVINPSVVACKLLADSPAVVGYVADRIYSPKLKADYQIEDGSAVTLFIRGGANDLYVPIVEPSFQVTAWAANAKLARYIIDDAVMKAIHGAEGRIVDTVDGPARFVYGVNDVYPQDVIDSDTGWFTCVGFFTIALVLDIGE